MSPIFLSTAISIKAKSFAPQECSEPNEEFQMCGPHDLCVRTCDNLNDILECSPVCEIGCFCRAGFVRGPKGNCIQPIECP